ncbi:hypothetical protein [Marinospirillum perlucidum]|uniref:hypothetical protein n=1 Tax=Marinospirillum perlucidum TaxID=1982602 RepID=UPI000DF32D4B|nr:hypothetical protein [Marinospirillum perlucidum]
MRAKHLAVFLFTLLFAVAVQARDYYVDITNNTGYTIMYVYVSPSDAETWEEDVLGNDILPNGNTQRVNLRGYKSPLFDIKLVDEDGDSYTYWNVDVSRRDINATLSDLD